MVGSMQGMALLNPTMTSTKFCILRRTMKPLNTLDLSCKRSGNFIADSWSKETQSLTMYRSHLGAKLSCMALLAILKPQMPNMKARMLRTDRTMYTASVFYSISSSFNNVQVPSVFKVNINVDLIIRFDWWCQRDPGRTWPWWGPAGILELGRSSLWWPSTWSWMRVEHV